MKQRAELRAVLAENSRYALLLQVTVVGNDIYSGLARTIGSKRRQIFRSSYHESGETRLHLPVGTERGWHPCARKTSQANPVSLEVDRLVSWTGLTA